MKNVIGLCAVFFLLNMSDLNPLLLWEPYRILLNETMHFLVSAITPGGIFVLILSAVSVIIWLGVEAEQNAQQLRCPAL